MVGARVLDDGGDKEFENEWRELFDASCHSHGEIAREPVVEEMLVESDARQDGSVGVDFVGLGGWRRAAMAPRVPIGVVA